MLRCKLRSLLLALSVLFVAAAEAQIVVRISVKIFLDEHGLRPISGDLNDDYEIVNAFETIGSQVDHLRDRGISFVVTEIIELNPNGWPAGLLPPAWKACMDGNDNRFGCSDDGDCPDGPCVNTGLAACAGGDDNRVMCDPDDPQACPGGMCDEPQTWTDCAVNIQTSQAIREFAHANPNEFALRSDAINVYIVGTEPAGGICNCQYVGGPHPDAIITVGQNHDPSVPLHEVGHWLGLCHTHGCFGDNGIAVGADETNLGIFDTLPDHPCWENEQAIAVMNYGACEVGQSCSIQTEADCTLLGGTYSRGTPCNPTPSDQVCLACEQIPGCTSASAGCELFLGNGATCLLYDNFLSFAQQTAVNHVFNNLMSYHWNAPDHDYLSPDQVDRMTDIMNGVQSAVEYGCTHFVDSHASAADLIGISACDMIGICEGSGEPGTECISEDEPFNDCLGGMCRRDLDGGSRYPYPTLQQAVVKAVPGDVILMRGGDYAENLVLSDPVFVLATEGTAVIGTD